jgi:hypothetical protein
MGTEPRQLSRFGDCEQAGRLRYRGSIPYKSNDYSLLHNIVTCGPFLGNEWANTLPTERLILGNRLITEHGFHGYETIRNQTVASELTHGFRENAFMKSSNGTLGVGDLYSVLSQLSKGVHL